jgi:hypothetical protein
MSQLEEKYVSTCRENLREAIRDLVATGDRCGFDMDSIISDITDEVYNETKITLEVIK